MSNKTKIGLIIGGLVVAFLLGYAAAPKAQPVVGGNLVGTPGIQDANAPVNTLSNEDILNLDVSNKLAVDGPATFGSTTSFTGSGTVITNLALNGNIDDISTTSATYTLSSSDICNSSYVRVTPLGAITTVTLPATSTLFSTCLKSVGQFILLNYQSTGTSTVIAAGAGGTLGYTSSTTVAAGKHGIFRIMRDSANTYDAYLVNVPN